MLKGIRKKHKAILWGMVVVIIPVFVLWGVGTRRGTRGPGYAGSIFGKEVSVEKYYESCRAFVNQILLQYWLYRDRIDLEQIIKYANPGAQGWHRLILLHEARKEGIKASDEEVIEQIKSIPLFQKEGCFDDALYEQYLKRPFGIEAKRFESQIREGLIISKLSKRVVENVTVSEEEVRENYKKENQEVKVSFILFEAAKFKNKMTAKEAEITEYYNNNKRLFKKPETVNVEYIGITYKEAGAGVSVDEEQIKEYYDSNQELFRLRVPEGEEAKYKQLKEVKEDIKKRLELEESKGLARERMEDIYDEVIERIEEKNVLAEVAWANGFEIKTSGFLAPDSEVPGMEQALQFSSAAFELGPGEVSEIVETREGCYILQLKEKKESYAPPLDEVKEEVRAAFLRDKAKESAKKKAEDSLVKLKEFLDRPNANFKKAARRLSLKAQNSSFVNRNGFLPEVGPCRTLPIFNLEEGELSDVVEIEKGYCFFMCEEIKDVDEEEFLKSRDRFTERVLNQKKSRVYQDWLRELILKAELRSNI